MKSIIRFSIMYYTRALSQIYNYRVNAMHANMYFLWEQCHNNNNNSLSPMYSMTLVMKSLELWDELFVLSWDGDTCSQILRELS